MDKKIIVNTKIGQLIAESTGTKDEYPGIFVYFKSPDKEEELIACIEHDTLNNKLQVCSYNQDFDWPINIEVIKVGKGE